MATVPVLAERLRALRDADVVRIVLDLREVEFADSCALRLMLSWNELADREGFTFALVNGPPAVQRVFHITQTAATFHFVEHSELTVRPTAG